MTYNEFEANVLQWAKDRGILEHGSYQGQCLKLIEEYGELAAAWARNNREGVKDAIGDICVVAAILDGMQDKAPYGGDSVFIAAAELQCSKVAEMARQVFHLQLEECWEQAWNTIKDRKGRMNAQGVFVKEE